MCLKSIIHHGFCPHLQYPRVTLQALEIPESGLVLLFVYIVYISSLFQNTTCTTIVHHLTMYIWVVGIVL